VIFEHHEDTAADFEGTIIDIETIGRFDAGYRNTADVREFQYIRQVMFGWITRTGLGILYVRDAAEITELAERAATVIDGLSEPFYAFNTSFERAVLYHQLGEEYTFTGELQKEKFESKAKAVAALGIPNYDDPFNDKGILCQEAWHDGRFAEAVAHNRACLLKERDILLLRGFRQPDYLRFP
jgi:hypothetical protein